MNKFLLAFVLVWAGGIACSNHLPPKHGFQIHLGAQIVESKDGDTIVEVEEGSVCDYCHGKKQTTLSESYIKNWEQRWGPRQKFVFLDNRGCSPCHDVKR